MALRCVGGFDQRHLFGDENAFGDVADFETDIDRHIFLGADDHVLAFKLFKTRSFCNDCVRCWNYVGKIVKAGRVGGAVAGLVGAFVGQRHLGVWHRGARRICYGSVHAALSGLRPNP